jgi:hypothetical protein
MDDESAYHNAGLFDTQKEGLDKNNVFCRMQNVVGCGNRVRWLSLGLDPHILD